MQNLICFMFLKFLRFCIHSVLFNVFCHYVSFKIFICFLHKQYVDCRPQNSQSTTGDIDFNFDFFEKSRSPCVHSLKASFCASVISFSFPDFFSYSGTTMLSYFFKNFLIA